MSDRDQKPPPPGAPPGIPPSRFAPPPRGAEEPLELALDPAEVRARVAAATGGDPSRDYGRPEKKRRGPLIFKLVLAFFILAVGLAATLVATGRAALPRGLVPAGVNLPGLRSEAIVLTVNSEPEGATVYINDQPIGETPLVHENVYPEDVPIPIKLTLRGYKPWTGTFAGGQVARIEAELQRR